MSDEKPWLLSSKDDLLRDELDTRKYKNKYKSSHPFPGIDAPIKTKMKWIAVLDATYEDIMEDSSYQASAPSTIVYAKELLYRNCPENVRIDFVVDCNKFQSIAKTMKEIEKKAFAENIAQYLKINEKSWTTFEECILYICENSKLPPCSDPDADTDATNEKIILASQTYKKDCEGIAEMDKILRVLGLTPYIKGAIGSSAENNHWQWGLDKILGKNMYTKDDSGVVYWRMFLQFNKTDLEKKEQIYTAELEEKIVKSEDRGNPKVYVLLKRKDVEKNTVTYDVEEEDSEEEEDIPTTPDCVQPLWLPKSYSEYYAKFGPHFYAGEGEVIDIQHRLGKGNTDTGNVKIMLFECEFRYAKQIKSIKEKFGAMLALTKIAQSDNYWMMDNEEPDQVKKMIKNLAAMWKEDLLKHDDSALGIGLGDGVEEETDDDGLSASRKLLYEFLELMAKEYMYEEDIDFDWKPATKKRKAPTSEKGNTLVKRKTK